MAKEVIYMKSNPASWIAIVLSVIALIISLVAWNIASKNSLQGRIQSLQQGSQNLSQQLSLQQARQRLQEISSGLSTNNNYDQALKDVTALRESLRMNFQHTTAQTQESWQNADSQLKTIQEQLQAKSTQVGATIATLLAYLNNFKLNPVPKAQ